MKEYDSNEAIKRMRNAIDADASAFYDDDQLINLIDIIWDYYEMNGLLEIDLEDDEDNTDIQSELIDYASRILKKDKGAVIKPEHIEPLVLAELAYEDELLDSSL